MQGIRDALQWLSVALPALKDGLSSQWARLGAKGRSNPAGAAATELQAHFYGVLELADGTLALSNVVLLSSAWLNAAGDKFASTRDTMRMLIRSPLTWLLTHIGSHILQLSGAHAWAES